MRSAFLTAVGQDPVLRDVKLIAEPWDLGPGGYQLGRFPPLWAEWNDKFRETVRSFWLAPSAEGSGVRDLAYRLSGSSDLYRDDGRRPYASINYVTSHDGLTLADLVEASGAERRRAPGQRAGRDHAPGDRRADVAGRGRAGTDAGRRRERLPRGQPDVVAATGRRRGAVRMHALVRQRARVAPRPAGAAAAPLLRRPAAYGRATPGSTARLPGRRRSRSTRTWPGSRPAGTEMRRRGLGRPTRRDARRAVRWDDRDRRRATTDVLVWLHAGSDDVEVTLPPDPRRRQWTLLLDTARPRRRRSGGSRAGGWPADPPRRLRRRARPRLTGRLQLRIGVHVVVGGREAGYDGSGRRLGPEVACGNALGEERRATTEAVTGSAPHSGAATLWEKIGGLRRRQSPARPRTLARQHFGEDLRARTRSLGVFASAVGCGWSPWPIKGR